MKCAVNPVIYFSMGELYRKRMLELFTCGCCDVIPAVTNLPVEERSEAERSTVLTEVTKVSPVSLTTVNGHRRHSSKV